jgi:hypothetical protein
MSIRVGVIGLNYGEAVHIPAYKENFKYKLVGVCARTAERAEAVAQEHGAQRWCTDARDLINANDIDLVSIASPPSTHAGYIVAAMAAGKHVAAEVAFAASAEDGRVLTDIARERGRIGAVAYVLRYSPNLRFIAELLAQGVIGEPRLMCVDYFNNFLALRGAHSRWMWDGDNGGGILAGSISHLFDLALRWFGPVREVDATLATLTDVKGVAGTGSLVRRGVLADDTGNVVLHFESGVLATFGYSAVVAYPRVNIELHGTKGTLHIEGLGEEVSVLRMGEQNAEVLFPPEGYIEATRGASGLKGGFNIFIDDLATAITTGAAPGGLPTFKDGWETTRLVDAAKKASREKRRVKVDEID